MAEKLDPKELVSFKILLMNDGVAARGVTDLSAK
jgi:hypothetical protein